jgi:hypothetical protein
MMKRMFSKRALRRELIALVVIAVITGAFLTWRLWLTSADGMRRSAVIVQCRSWYQLNANGQPQLYLSELQQGDTPFRMVSLHRDSAWQYAYAEGCWMNRFAWLPSCHGRLVTVRTDTATLCRMGPHILLQQERRMLKNRLKDLLSEESELKYYLRVHSVRDNGYQAIASLAVRTDSAIADVRRTMKVIGSINPRAHLVLTRMHAYTVFYHNANGRLKRVYCLPVNRHADKQLLLLQTVSHLKPLGVLAESVMPWGRDTNGPLVAIGFEGLSEPAFVDTTSHPVIIPGRQRHSRHDIAPIQAANGAPVFSEQGRFTGIIVGREIVGRQRVAQLFKKEEVK